MRSKYNTYPEYHTSLDNLDLISADGLGGGFEIYRAIIAALEVNVHYKVTTICEPRLGIRNLYPDLHRKEISDEVAPILNFLTYADGTVDLIDLSTRIELSIDFCCKLAQRLLQAGLVEIVQPSPPESISQ
jgi:aminopeptidase-like protein